MMLPDLLRTQVPPFEHFPMVEISHMLRYSRLSPNRLRNAVNQGSLAKPHVGTRSTIRSNTPRHLAAIPLISPQVFNLIRETAWVEDQNPPLSSQFENQKSKHAPIVRFLDKEYPHC